MYKQIKLMNHLCSEDLNMQPFKRNVKSCEFESDSKNGNVQVLGHLYVKPKGISYDQIKDHWNNKWKIEKTTKASAFKYI